VGIDLYIQGRVYEEEEEEEEMMIGMRMAKMAVTEIGASIALSLTCLFVDKLCKKNIYI
jgi:riboflavin synthase alpha subunit